MRVILNIAADYPDHMRPVFDALAEAQAADQPIDGLSREDVIDAFESADEFAIVGIERID